MQKVALILLGLCLTFNSFSQDNNKQKNLTLNFLFSAGMDFYSIRGTKNFNVYQTFTDNKIRIGNTSIEPGFSSTFLLDFNLSNVKRLSLESGFNLNYYHSKVQLNGTDKYETEYYAWGEVVYSNLSVPILGGVTFGNNHQFEILAGGFLGSTLTRNVPVIYKENTENLFYTDCQCTPSSIEDPDGPNVINYFQTGLLFKLRWLQPLGQKMKLFYEGHMDWTYMGITNSFAGGARIGLKF